MSVVCITWSVRSNPIGVCPRATLMHIGVGYLYGGLGGHSPSIICHDRYDGDCKNQEQTKAPFAPLACLPWASLPRRFLAEDFWIIIVALQTHRSGVDVHVGRRHTR